MIASKRERYIIPTGIDLIWFDLIWFVDIALGETLVFIKTLKKVTNISLIDAAKMPLLERIKLTNKRTIRDA